MKTYKTNSKIYSIKSEETDFKRVKISGSESAAEYARNFYFDDIEIYESFFLTLLNNHNNTIGFAKISQGGITGTVVDVRILAKYALDTLATAVILVHNHPSGTLRPSQNDKKITNRIKQALELIDVKVLDHIILTKENYFSFADDSLL
jgi:DNA repair protein RadC